MLFHNVSESSLHKIQLVLTQQTVSNYTNCRSISNLYNMNLTMVTVHCINIDNITERTSCTNIYPTKPFLLTHCHTIIRPYSRVYQQQVTSQEIWEALYLLTLNRFSIALLQLSTILIKPALLHYRPMVEGS